MGRKKGLPNRLNISKYKNEVIASELRQKSKITNEDTTVRRNIHKLIIELLKKHKGKISILKELQNEFPNTKYSVYFGDWIDYHIEKMMSPFYKGDDEGR